MELTLTRTHRSGKASIPPPPHRPAQGPPPHRPAQRPPSSRRSEAEAEAGTVGAASRRTVVWAYLSVLLLAAVVFAPTLLHTFVWDDLEQVRDNEYIRHWSSFREFWLKDILALSRKGGDLHSNYYRPLFYVQYLLLYKIFGLNTLAWHAMAILAHGLTSCAVLLFVRRLGLSLQVAWMSALLFAVHPAHGESVSWIAAAFNDPPAAAFLLLGLVAHVAWQRGKGSGYIGLGLLGYAGALCLKESGLSMLLLVPLVTWFVASARPWMERLTGLAPYFGLTAVYFAVRVLTIGTAFGVYEHSKPVAEIAPTFPMLGVFYVRLLLWPFQLSPSYPLRYVPGWGDLRAWGSLLALAALAAGVFFLTRRRRVFRFGALWVVCCIWPVFNIRSFLPTYLAHQRYLYLASLGLCLAIAWALSQLVGAASVRVTVLAAILTLWSASNLYHDRFWATDMALWTRISAVDPHNPAGFDWRGARAMDEARDAAAAGRTNESARKLDEAEALFRGSIQADPSSPFGYHNLALLLHTLRKAPGPALPLYETAIERFAARPQSQLTDLVVTRLDRAACLGALGRGEEALREFLALADSPPYPPSAAENAAVLYLQSNRPDLVEATLARGLSRAPNDAGLLRKMAEFSLMTGRAAQASEYARRFAAVSPGDPAALELLRRAQAGAAPH